MEEEVRSLPKIALIADPHFSLRNKAEERRWDKALWWKALPKSIKESVYFSFETRRQYIERVIARIRATGPYDFVAVLGDITPGVKRNGIVGDAAERDAEAFIQRMGEIRCPVYYVLGGHDVGRGVDNITRESLENAQSLFGPLHFSKFWNGTRCVFLCSELVRARTAKDAAITALHEQQRAFLVEEVLYQSHDVALFMHDPRALHAFDDILGVYPRRIKATFCGHFHYRWMRYLLHTQSLYSAYNVHVVPSPWGWFLPSVGRGTFTVVEKGWGGQLKVYKMR